LGFGLLIVSFSLALAFAGPSLAPRNPLEETRVMQVDGKFVSAPFPPFTYPGYPLGTDGWGRDVLSQVLWASRPTLILTGYVAVLRLALGTIIGLLAGWNKNSFGVFLNSLISAALSIPTLLVALAVVALTGDFWQPWGFVLGLSITGWADSARLVREQTRVAREQSFIEASRALGQSAWIIVFKHIMRLVLPYVWMLLALEISSTILLTAGLGFLGYYVGGEVWVWISDTTATRLRGMPELGQLLSGVNEDIYVSPWKLFASGTFVFITVLGFNLLGEGLRRVAISGSPSPRLFDLSLRLRWGWEENIILPIKKYAKESPFAFAMLVIRCLQRLLQSGQVVKSDNSCEDRFSRRALMVEPIWVAVCHAVRGRSRCGGSDSRVGFQRRSRLHRRTRRRRGWNRLRPLEDRYSACSQPGWLIQVEILHPCRRGGHARLGCGGEYLRRGYAWRFNFLYTNGRTPLASRCA
jgi:ABC-type dipeptide/oligopeptide/nickel transport system permease subunit